jgi:hypothetical protein
MKINLQFSENNYTEIELFDYPAVRKWFEYYIAQNVEYYVTYKKEPRWKEVRDEKHIEENWKLIIDTLEELKKMGLYPNFVLPHEFNFDQQLLNQIHRFFTYNHMWWEDRFSKPNPFNSQFTVSEDIETAYWFDTICKLNDGVHELEKTLITAREMALTENKITFLQTTFWPKMDTPYNNLWLDFDKEMINHCYRYRDFIDFDNLVYLNESILGKPYMRCFFNNDDPNAEDITGRLGSHGGFEIDLHGSRKSFYKSVMYDNWLKQHNVINPPEEFVIGKIYKHSFNNLNDMQDYELIKVIFSDDEV